MGKVRFELTTWLVKWYSFISLNFSYLKVMYKKLSDLDLVMEVEVVIFVASRFHYLKARAIS